MSDPEGTESAETVVRRFMADSSGSMDDHIEACLRWVHPDAYFATGGFDPPRIPDRDVLVADLDKAKARLQGFDYEILTLAVTGDRVLTERFDRIIGLDGAVAHEFRVMGIARVVDGRIAWWRDYFYDTNEFTRYLPERPPATEPPVLAQWLRAGG